MNPEKIETLKQPEIFPEKPGQVEIIQTHLSVVCLAGDRVYKLKKSLKFPFADFSSLEKRRKFCEDELQLNRRLCPEVYLDVVPLMKSSEGGLRFEPGEENRAEGEIIDYAVRMIRLPADRMLDVVLKDGEVREKEVREIARRMVTFHREEARRDEEVINLGSPQKLKRFALNNFKETQEMTGQVFPPKLHRALENRTTADFERYGGLLQQRAKNGFVVEGHGDLHARNICLTDPVAIYDCIEFNSGFRCGDVATEHAFLVMDLRFRGHAYLARSYLETVADETDDEDLSKLMPMLVRYRAMVRAKVAAITAGEDEVSQEERREADKTARSYLRFAAATAVEEGAPLWIALCGLPATGKSTLARALTEASGTRWPIFSSDLVRKELAEASPHDRLSESYYRPEFSRRTYDELYRRAEAASGGNNSVVLLDANFRSRVERSKLKKAARESGAELVIVEIKAGEGTIRKRLEERAASHDAASDADLQIYEKLKKTFEAPTPEEADRFMQVSANPDPAAPVDQVLAKLV